MPEKDWLKINHDVPYTDLDDTVILDEDDIMGIVIDEISGKAGLVVRAGRLNVIIMLTRSEIEITAEKWKGIARV